MPPLVFCKVCPFPERRLMLSRDRVAGQLLNISLRPVEVVSNLYDVRGG